MHSQVPKALFEPRAENLVGSKLSVASQAVPIALVRNPFVMTPFMNATIFFSCHRLSILLPMCQVPVARLRTAVTDAMEPHGNMACWYISGCEFSGLKITLEEPLTYISPKKGYFFVGRGKVPTFSHQSQVGWASLRTWQQGSTQAGYMVHPM